MKSKFLSRFKLIASLKLTIACLAAAMVLVFIGTLDQVNVGVHEAENRYFNSLFLFFRFPGSNFTVPWFPGGLTLEIVLLVNLVAAHLTRYRLTWKKSGIWVLHSGLILLIAGQLVAGLFRVESQLVLDQGGAAKNYSESPFLDEVALIDRSDPKSDQVISVAFDALRSGQRLPLNQDLALAVNDVYPNAAVINPGQLPSASYPHLPLGPMAVAARIEPTFRQDERNQPAVALTLLRHGEPAGTWNLAAAFPQPKKFVLDGKNWAIVLRPKRYYRPYSLRLEEFRHDRYAGTEIAKNFSSRVRLVDSTRHEDREAVIYMNHPLRYGGLTYYQASYANDDRTTVLQVMQNPSSILPYVACAMMAAGMLFQFGHHLISFLSKRRSTA